MKNCLYCQAELDDNAMFCGKCGKRQEAVAEGNTVSPVAPLSAAQPDATPAAHPPQPPVQGYPDPVAEPYPPQQQVAPGAPPPYPHPYPSEPKPPSALALEGKRYLNWLGKGILGTTEPMHFLFAAIVPFFITLFYTLAMSKMMNWHAGGFFLMWFFNMIMIVAMPTAAWLCKRYWLKEDMNLQDVFARYSSYMNIVLPITLFAMIIGFAVSINSAGGLNFLRAILHLVPLLSFAASTLICIPGSNGNVKRPWLVILVLAAVYIILFFLSSVILTAGMNWGWRRLIF